MTPEAHRDYLIEKFGKEFGPKYDSGQVSHSGKLWKKPSALRNAKEEVLDQWSYINVIEHQIKVAISLLKKNKQDEAVSLLRGIIK